MLSLSSIWHSALEGAITMVDSIDASFQGNGLFVTFYAALVGTALILLVIHIFRKHKKPEEVHYVETEYQSENISELFVAPKQIDTSY